MDNSTTRTASAPVLTLYLLQLVVPALAIVDALGARRRFEYGLFEKAALAVGGVWLAAGLAAILVGALRRRISPLLPRIVLAIYSSLIGVAAVETLAARVLSDPQDHRIFLRPPNLRLTCTADPAAMPGIDATTVLSANRWGLRGPQSDPEPGTYRIITVGGSTTECLYLDDTQEWPRLVMDGLNQAAGAHATWVANAGFSGHTAVHHLALLQTLPVFENADAWIIMPGINDFQDSLAREGKPTQDELEQSAEQTIYGNGMRLSRARIVLPLRRAMARLNGAPEAPVRRSEPWYGDNRAKRAGMKVVPLPDLTVALAEYRERILRLGAECRARNKRCLFLTQPTMWRSDLPPELEKLMWFGWTGSMQNPKGFVSIADLARGMRQYNEVLLHASRDAGMESLDLAAAVPKDTRALFDDCHFNVNGAHLVADAITTYLRAGPPFHRPG